VFEHVKGVVQVTSGYAGGRAESAAYETVSTGTTGHAESVRIVFDPSVVSYETLLKVFFTVAHDPTELNRQGPTSARSIARRSSLRPRRSAAPAQAVIDSLTHARAFPRPS